MTKYSKKRQAVSYKKRLMEVNRIYEAYARSGLPNRAIWLRYIYPAFGICERTFYNLLKASAREENLLSDDQQMTLQFAPINYVSPFS